MVLSKGGLIDYLEEMNINNSYTYLSEANEESTIKRIVNNSINSKNASSACIRSIKALTTEIIKVNDLIIKLLDSSEEKKSSKDISAIKSFNDEVEKLNSYITESVDVDDFQVNVKELYKKVGTIMRDFNKNIVRIVESNKLEGKLSRSTTRVIEKMIECFECINKYSNVNVDEAKEVKDKLTKLKNNSTNKKNVKALKESLNFYFIPVKYYNILDESENKGGFGTNVYTGVSSTLGGLFNIFDKGFHGLSSETTKFGGFLDRLFSRWKNTEYEDNLPKGHNERDYEKHTESSGVFSSKTTYIRKGNWDACKNFLTSSEFTQAVSGMIALAGAFLAIRWAYRKVKDTFKKIFK